MARISVPLRSVNAHTLRRWLPARRRESHKGDYGRLLLLCGSVGYTGAPVLAAQAAVRSGAGLVFSCVPEAVYPIVAARLLEPMVVPLPSEEGKFSADAIPQALERLERCDACLIGCGMGQSAATAELVRAVLAQAHCPVVLDADGINVLAGHIDVLRGAACPVIVTPHEGEFRRLFGAYTTSRLAAAKEFYAQTGATLLLKGHRSLIVGAEGCFENRCGNPGMATGGSGDVLSPSWGSTECCRPTFFCGCRDFCDREVQAFAANYGTAAPDGAAFVRLRRGGKSAGSGDRISGGAGAGGRLLVYGKHHGG